MLTPDEKRAALSASFYEARWWGDRDNLGPEAAIAILRGARARVASDGNLVPADEASVAVFHTAYNDCIEWTIRDPSGLGWEWREKEYWRRYSRELFEEAQP